MRELSPAEGETGALLGPVWGCVVALAEVGGQGASPWPQQRLAECRSGLREAQPLADGSSWAHRGAGVGFRTQPLQRDVSFESGRLEGLSRGCYNLHAGEL